MQEGALTGGSTLIPTFLASSIIDVARNNARVIQAGALTVPMVAPKVTVARFNTDPTASWHAESAAISASDPNVDSIVLSAHTLTCLVRISVELFEDAVNLGSEVTNAIGRSMGLELDRASLYGSGTAPEPRGIKTTTGITATAFGGANGATPANHDFLVDGFQTLAAGNFEPTGVIDAPRTEATIAKLKDTIGQPMEPPAAVVAVPRWATNQIPVNLTVGTSTNCSDVFVGQWDQLFIGVRTELQLRFLAERYADVGEVAFLAMIRADVQLARPSAFTVISGIRP